MSGRGRRRVQALASLALICAASSSAGAIAKADPTLLAQSAPAGGFDLNVAALLVAAGTLIAGIVGYLRLRAERPKIVAEIASSNEERLRAALDAAWEEADRLRKLRELERGELERCNARIGELERRERELEDEVDALRRRIAELERA